MLKSKVENIAEILYGATLLLVTSAISIGFLGIDSQNSYYKLSFAFLVIWIFVELAINKKIDLRLDSICGIVMIGICIILVVFESLVKENNGLLPLQGLTFLACLLCGLICIIKKEWTIITLLFFQIITIGGAAIFLYAFFSVPTYWSTTQSRTISSFNPQGVGTWAFLFYVSLIMTLDMHIDLLKKKIIIVLVVAVTILYAYILIKASARGATVVLGMFAILRLLPIIKISRSKAWAVIISFFPMLTTYISIFMYNKGWLISQGRSFLDGREMLWEFYLEDARRLLLFGNERIDNSFYSHNIYVDQFYEYGIIFAFLFMLCNYCILRHVIYLWNINEKLQRYMYDGYIAFCGAVVLSALEGMVFSTGFGGAYFFVYSFIFIACYRENNISKKG